MKIILITTGIFLSFCLAAQDFIFGHDLSYLNQMEDCGAVFKENSIPKDPFSIFADHGTNLVRVRLWVDPSWWQDSLVQPEGESLSVDLHHLQEGLYLVRLYFRERSLNESRLIAVPKGN